MNKHDKKRLAKKSTEYLNMLLKEFYDFLESKPQPGDEQVRTMFIQQEGRWRLYCTINKLNGEVKLLFKRQVALQWKQN